VGVLNLKAPPIRADGLRPLAESARRFTTAHPLLVDVGVAALVALVVLTRDLTGPDNPRHELPTPPYAWIFDLALVLPLIWRRRAPGTVFAVVAIVAFGQWYSGTLAVGPAAVLLALYTIAAHRNRRVLLLLAVVTAEVGAVLVAIRWAPPHHGFEIFVLVSGTVTAAATIGIYARIRRRYLATLRDRAVRAERDRDQQARIAAAAERERIAREMHDIVAHSLSVMIALTSGAGFAVRTSPENAQIALDQSARVGREALTEMRRLLGVLREDDHVLHPQPGMAELDDLLASVRTAGLTGELTVTGQPALLPSSAQLAIYRIVQEAITNVLKHARSPRRINVSLVCGHSGVDLEVVDDGLIEPGPETHPGHGLTGMRERAGVFGGQIEAGPRAGGGWRVHTQLPVRASPMPP
jgi:signal transduction histidine kinase